MTEEVCRLLGSCARRSCTGSRMRRRRRSSASSASRPARSSPATTITLEDGRRARPCSGRARPRACDYDKLDGPGRGRAPRAGLSRERRRPDQRRRASRGARWSPRCAPGRRSRSRRSAGCSASPSSSRSPSRARRRATSWPPRGSASSRRATPSGAGSSATSTTAPSSGSSRSRSGSDSPRRGSAASPDRGRQLLEAAADELAQALTELRELAQGLHPAVLTERGLAAALEVLAARTPLPVALEVRLPERLPESIEAAAYFVASEALANVVKHAACRRPPSVRAAHLDGRVAIEVEDDGTGLAEPGGRLGPVGPARPGRDARRRAPDRQLTRPRHPRPRRAPVSSRAPSTRRDR